MSIAQSLLDIVVDEAARHQVTKIKRVGVRVGAYSALVPDSLRFCWDLIIEDTVAAGAELTIDEIPMMGVCNACNAQITMTEPVFECPECKSADFELTQGRELMVDYIETED